MEQNFLHLDKEDGQKNDFTSNNHVKSNSAFLQILPVTLTNGTKSVHTNALLDSGSDATLIRDDIARKLNMYGEVKTLKIGNALSNSLKVQSRLVSFELASESHPDPIRITNAYAVPQLNIKYEKVQFDQTRNNFPHLRDINLPPPNNSDVTLLIGADFPKLHLQIDYRYLSDDQPCAIKTELGWVLFGGKRISAEIQANRLQTAELETFDIERFWSIENYGTIENNNTIMMTKAEKMALKTLNDTITFRNGHYEVGMLWKYPQRHLPNNRSLAVLRLNSLERRLKRYPEQAAKYAETIKRYLELGHATKLTPEEASKTSYITNYIPHHFTTNPNKENKFRIVFDASAKFASVCLNDFLLKGPDLLNNLVTVLLKFRNGKYAVSADIEKMFHQIYVRMEDRDALRFLWRENPGDKIEEYRMNVHLFGKNDSPCIANFSLNQSSKDQLENFNEMVLESVKNNFYMDDFLKAGENIENLSLLSKQLTLLLSNKGFRLTKWISNSQEILTQISKTELETADKIESMSYEKCYKKVLGLLWNTKTDIIKIPTNIKSLTNTKRGLLSVLCSIFDPLGIVAPCLIEAKLIIQELWRRNVNWDETLPADLEKRAKKWTDSIKHLNDIELPRYYGFDILDNSAELHIFADSSSKAYGCVAYLRANLNGETIVSFVLGKSRLAPLKEKCLSIPKLELQAAVTAVRVKEKLMKEANLKISKTFYWSDSKAVLKYISNEDKHFPIYVMHRLAEIRSKSKITEWNYIPTNLNTSDLCTRPTSFKDFQTSKKYLSGPRFLQVSDITSFIGKDRIFNEKESIDTTRKYKNAKVYATLSQETQESKTLVIWKNFSTWTKLLRAIVFLKKFIILFKLRRIKQCYPQTLQTTTDIINSAHDLIIAKIQKEAFHQEIKGLSSEGQINHTSCLLPLNPIYRDQILRVGGRLKNVTSISESNKHPIILPREHYVTSLLILHYHEQYHHCGRNHTLSSLERNIGL